MFKTRLMTWRALFISPCFAAADLEEARGAAVQAKAVGTKRKENCSCHVIQSVIHHV